MSRSHYEKYRKKKIIEIKPEDVPVILSEKDYPSSLNSNTSRELSIRMHWPLFYAYLNKNYPCDEFDWREKLWCFYHGISKRPVCKECGKPVKFHTGKGFAEYCSTKCANQSSSKVTATENTKLERYGDKHYVNPEKAKNTKLEKYGDEGYNNRNKALQTISDKGGEGFGNASKSAHEKQKQTMVERYGTDCLLKDENVRKENTKKRMSHIDEISAKIKTSLNKNFQEKVPDAIESVEPGVWKFKCPHSDCTKCSEKWYEINVRQLYYRMRHPIELCTKLLPIQTARNSGTGLEVFVRCILDDNNIEYETNNRTILSGKEIDIFIPSKNIAIECNGCFWHASDKHPTTYHYNKWKECKNKGIQLISVWEDQIISKPVIVESLLLSKLGIYKERIGARECNVAEIESDMAKRFCEYNHLQGWSGGSLNIGLVHDNELVGVMIFGKRNKQKEWELVRYCTKPNMQVIGGASKMFSYFVDTYNPDKIISFSSNDISDGGLYERLGFKKESEQKYSYWYIKQYPLKRYHRSSFTKDAIVKKGWKDSKEGWTETEAMTQQGFLQIYDSGQQKWIYENNTSKQ